MASGRSSTVFVGNIPYDATEEDIRQMMSQAGKVESFRMVFDKDTKQPRGYGFCDFADPDMAMNAIKTLSDTDINGRKLRLDLTDSGKGSGKGGPARLALPSSAGTTLALTGPAPEQRRPVDSGPPRGAAPVKTTGVGVEGSGIVNQGQIDPATVSAATAVDRRATPEAIMASVEAHTEIAQTVAAMSKAQLQLCLGTMQKLAQEAPEHSRAALQENPQLCYALLHAQFLLGLTLEPSMPPDAEETHVLRSEAVQRVMAHQKAMVAGKGGGKPVFPGMSKGPGPGLQQFMAGGAMYGPQIILPPRPGQLGGPMSKAGCMGMSGLPPPPPPAGPYAKSGVAARPPGLMPSFSGVAPAGMDVG